MRLPRLSTSALGDGPPLARAARPASARAGRPWFLPEGRHLPDEVWQRRHQGLTRLLWAHLPLLYGFAIFMGFSPLAAGMQMAVLLLPAITASLPSLSRNVRSASTSIGLVVGASVLVHLSGGSIEAHFQFFVILAFLTLYQAWLPFLLALLYVVVEHGVIGALDPGLVYNSTDATAHPWRYAFIHGGFVLAASFANILSWRLTEQESLRDGLTGRPNRTALLQALEKNVSRRGTNRTALLFIDLDNFKDANDAFGHHTGDALLIALAERLEAQLRPGDLLSRLGGDEFSILLTDLLDAQDAVTIAERILKAVREEIVIGDLTLVTYASIGLAHSDGVTDAAELLRNADLAMYEAKRAGGDRVASYRPVLHTAALRRTALEAELRVATEMHQLVLHYQPIIELGSGAMVGTEALLRWEHPTRGLLPPSEFIEAAEQSGLIVPMGAWVIRTACMQAAAWHAQQPDRAPLTVAVNLSPRQLVDRTLVATVADALHDSGLDASSLCLEITEGSVIKDVDQAMPVLHALRRLGVSLALDDFGTGYSSLSYLQQLPVTSVKIDRSFVGSLGESGPNTQIVLAIIELAHALGLSVTAEGVETVAQLDMLTNMGTDQVQGYLTGRPVLPVSDLAPAAPAPVPDPRSHEHDTRQQAAS